METPGIEVSQALLLQVLISEAPGHCPKRSPLPSCSVAGGISSGALWGRACSLTSVWESRMGGGEEVEREPFCGNLKALADAPSSSRFCSSSKWGSDWPKHGPRQTGSCHGEQRDHPVSSFEGSKESPEQNLPSERRSLFAWLELSDGQGRGCLLHASLPAACRSCLGSDCPSGPLLLPPSQFMALGKLPDKASLIARRGCLPFLPPPSLPPLSPLRITRGWI